MIVKKFFYLFIFLLLSACANTEKPSYILTNSELHQYRNGDNLRYGLLNLSSAADARGTLTYTFESRDLFTPANNFLSVFFLKTDTDGNVNFPFVNTYFTQTEDGNLTLEAYSESDKAYWLIEQGNTTTGEVFYNSPLSDISEKTVIDMPLQNCPTDISIDICTVSGSTRVDLTPLGTETVDTDYAKFEAYKFNIDWTVNTDSKLYLISGTQWVYPPLGVVKFNYTITTELGSNTLIGTLTATNIKIPAANKSASAPSL